MVAEPRERPLPATIFLAEGSYAADTGNAGGSSASVNLPVVAEDVTDGDRVHRRPDRVAEGTPLARMKGTR